MFSRFDVCARLSAQKINNGGISGNLTVVKSRANIELRSQSVHSWGNMISCSYSASSSRHRSLAQTTELLPPGSDTQTSIPRPDNKTAAYFCARQVIKCRVAPIRHVRAYHNPPSSSMLQMRHSSLPPGSRRTLMLFFGNDRRARGARGTCVTGGKYQQFGFAPRPQNNHYGLAKPKSAKDAGKACVCAGYGSFLHEQDEGSVWQGLDFGAGD